MLALVAALGACGTQVDGATGGPDAGATADAHPGDADAAPPDARPPDAGAPDAPPIIDQDGDGLDDAYELELARTYRPYLSVTDDDGCRLGGIVVRVRPHPADATKIHIIYDHLYQNDCGLTGHVGDDEVFAITVDPAVPPPAGILAMRGIGHQGTICEKTSDCGSCPGLDACELAGAGADARPIVYSSKDKHASYVQMSVCNPFTSCFDSCALSTASDDPPMVNAGEPDKPLVIDLTDQGFITAANGWSEASLMHFDPWDTGTDFGGAGNVAGDLVDPAFDTPVCN
jgi:hypothetical protein